MLGYLGLQVSKEPFCNEPKLLGPIRSKMQVR
jgi:hypothetical protein